MQVSGLSGPGSRLSVSSSSESIANKLTTSIITAQKWHFLEYQSLAWDMRSSTHRSNLRG